MNRSQIFEFDNSRYRMFPEDKKIFDGELCFM